MDKTTHWAFLRPLTWDHVALIAGVVAGCALLIVLVQLLVRRAAEEAPSHHRLIILRAAPLARLAITIAGLVTIIPLLVEPTFDDVIALVATAGLAVAFAVKDYISSLIAGLVAIVENTYQPGDWIEFDGVYGEVRTIGLRAVHIVTIDETEVTVPHEKLWTSKLSNASNGSHTLLTITHFWLDADHDGAAVAAALAEVAAASPHLKVGSHPKIVATETPFGTHYKIKAHVAESRDQYAMTTDMTLRGKARLRAMGVGFARAGYVEAEGK